MGSSLLDFAHPKGEKGESEAPQPHHQPSFFLLPFLFLSVVTAQFSPHRVCRMRPRSRVISRTLSRSSFPPGRSAVRHHTCHSFFSFFVCRGKGSGENRDVCSGLLLYIFLRRCFAQFLLGFLMLEKLKKEEIGFPLSGFGARGLLLHFSLTPSSHADFSRM